MAYLSYKVMAHPIAGFVCVSIRSDNLVRDARLGPNNDSVACIQTYDKFLFKTYV